MKKISRSTLKYSIIFLISLSLIACDRGSQKITGNSDQTVKQPIDTAEMTNNFYDNTETINLPLNDLMIEGEIANPGMVDFSQMPVHSVIVKETLLDSAGGDRFIGAYRYDGYSLFDILEKRVLQKINKDEFAPIIDLFVEIQNATGEKVVFSWGEIYYPNNLHRIIIATGVSRIVPSKTKELWPLPGTSKIVAGNDLVTERNISGPVKITVRSIRKSFPVTKGMSPMYSADLKLFQADDEVPLRAAFNEKAAVTFNTIFYGRGRGIHSTSPFTGFMLKDLLSSYCPVNRLNLQSGMLCLVGKDGYRCAVSYSELFNRNDQQEFLLIKTKPGEDGGLFRIFPACDFFSDRAIKSLSEIHAGI
jgi:hypothetical protein